MSSSVMPTRLPSELVSLGAGVVAAAGAAAIASRPAGAGVRAGGDWSSGAGRARGGPGTRRGCAGAAAALALACRACCRKSSPWKLVMMWRYKTTSRCRASATKERRAPVARPSPARQCNQAFQAIRGGIGTCSARMASSKVMSRPSTSASKGSGDSSPPGTGPSPSLKSSSIIAAPVAAKGESSRPGGGAATRPVSHLARAGCDDFAAAYLAAARGE